MSYNDFINIRTKQPEISSLEKFEIFREMINNKDIGIDKYVIKLLVDMKVGELLNFCIKYDFTAGLEYIIHNFPEKAICPAPFKDGHILDKNIFIQAVKDILEVNATLNMLVSYVDFDLTNDELFDFIKRCLRKKNSVSNELIKNVCYAFVNSLVGDDYINLYKKLNDNFQDVNRINFLFENIPIIE